MRTTTTTSPSWRKGSGTRADSDRYLKRSQAWRNVWDDALTSDGFSGFVHGRTADGQFSTVDATKGYNTDFYEGTCWEFSYDVPHDVPGLILKMGGPETFVNRLLHALKRGYIDFGNEPSFMTIWLFDQVKRPYLTSYWADQFRSKFKGLDLPGDDDSGAMSSLFLFLNAGLFPVAGQDVYYLHGARVPRFTFHQPNGKTFVIVGENAGASEHVRAERDPERQGAQRAPHPSRRHHRGRHIAVRHGLATECLGHRWRVRRGSCRGRATVTHLPRRGHIGFGRERSTQGRRSVMPGQSSLRKGTAGKPAPL